MAGNTIEYKGRAAVNTWNNQTKELTIDVRQELHEIKGALEVIMQSSEGETAELLSQYASNIGSASDSLYEGMCQLNDAVQKWAERAEMFEQTATTVVKNAASALN